MAISLLLSSALAASALLIPARAAAQQAQPASASFVELQGGRACWQTLTLTFTARESTHELLHAPGANPFLDRRLTVTFRHALSGTERVVGGFFAADGDAADTSASGGARWRARFCPELAGAWSWSAEFRRGAGIAIDREQLGASADPRIDGAFGTFHVAPADPSAPGFERTGRLEYTGERYFRFAETGEPFLKNGAGGPENLFGYYEFDGTNGDQQSLCLNAPENPEHLHRYAPHALDFLGDEVDLRHTWAGGKGTNILGMINYLASVGVNGFYSLANTYKGDGDDAWPWVAALDNAHFDVSKLEQWERLFAHLTQRGLLIQFVFEEQENDQLTLAQGGLGLGLTNERKLFYRELVARFAHHPALIWIVGDESNYYDEPATMQQLANEIHALDPYDHPLTFHGKHPCSGGGCPQQIPTVYAQYLPYFGFTGIAATAFQTAPGGYSSSTAQLVSGTSAHPWAIFGDEQSLNAVPSNRADNRKKALWGNLMAGGAGIAWYPGNNVASQYPPGVVMCDYYDLAIEDMRLLELYFLEGSYALSIFHAQLPFTEMQANNGLASPSGGQDYVFHRPRTSAPV